MGVAVEIAKDVWHGYQPIITEVSGVADFTLAMKGLIQLSVYGLRSSNSRTDFMIAPHMPWICAILAAQGLIKLALPIIASTGYLIYRSCY